MGADYNAGTNGRMVWAKNQTGSHNVLNNVLELTSNEVATKRYIWIGFSNSVNNGANYVSGSISHNVFQAFGAGSGFNGLIVMQCSQNLTIASNRFVGMKGQRNILVWHPSVTTVIENNDLTRTDATTTGDLVWLGGPGAHGAGLAGAVVRNNKFTNSGKGLGIFNMNYNAIITENDFSAVGGLAIEVDNTGAGTADATCNWFGSSVIGDVQSAVSGNVTFLRYLTNGTDNDPAIGFQPVPNSCNGPVLTLMVDAPSTANCGDEVTVYVKSTGFVGDVSTLQFSVNWDPTQLGYVSSSFDPAVYSAGGDDPLITHPATSLTGPDGAVTYVWGDGNPPYNVAIPDNSDLMSLTFTVLLAGNLEINLSGTPTEIGATDSDFEPIDVVTNNDEITVVNSCIQLITVTADDLSKFCGQLDPAFTFQITEGELAEGDVFTGSLEREPGETAGTYAITQGTLSLEGYSITFIPGVFEIKGITVDASASSTPVQLGSTATLSAQVSPAVSGLSVSFYLDGVLKGSGLTNGFGVATLPVSGLALDVYKVEARVGTCASSEAYLPVFDPNGSFVTGGGWINSPQGAYVADPILTGKANFGFVSRYKKGSSQVDGNTEFQFNAGGLNFKSTMNESGSLVISGRRATYRGTGTINGQSGFKFVVVAIDGNWNGQTNPDAFRIKISTTSGGVIYDNQMGSDENTEDASILGGGSIVIHEAKGKGNKRIEPGSMEDEMNSTFETNEKEFAPNTIRIYPNPASEVSNIQVNLYEGSDVTFKVFDAAGRVVMEEQSYQERSFTRTLELKGLSNGLYHVVVQVGNQVMTKRLVKQ